jgi:hypothetical protein
VQRRHLDEDFPLGPKQASPKARFASREKVCELGVAVQLDDGTLVSFARRVAQSSDVWPAGCEPEAGENSDLNEEGRVLWHELSRSWSARVLAVDVALLELGSVLACVRLLSKW